MTNLHSSVSATERAVPQLKREITEIKLRVSFLIELFIDPISNQNYLAILFGFHGASNEWHTNTESKQSSYSSDGYQIEFSTGSTIQTHEDKWVFIGSM